MFSTYNNRYNIMLSTIIVDLNAIQEIRDLKIL